MDQNALDQTDYRNDLIARFFAYWYKFMKIKSWLKNILVILATLVTEDSKIDWISIKN